MEYKNFAKKIIELKNSDLKLRDHLLEKGEMNEGYNEAMQKLHNRNARILETIIDRIGYPTTDKVGEIASEAAWLVIQHAIGLPSLMRSCAHLLEVAVKENGANPINLAYLVDRIAVLEGKAQHYGTQFDWDENGELSPSAIDEIEKVNQRRKQLGLNSLQEQTKIIRDRVKSENQLPPSDLDKRRLIFDEWRKSVGWIE